METRKCSICGIEKPIEEFYRDKSKPGGRRSECRECIKIRGRIYYEKNRDKIVQRNKDYYVSNIDICRQRRQIYREDHAEEIRLHNHEVYKENSKFFNAQSRAYYQQTKEEQKKQKRIKHENNPALMMWTSAKRRASKSGLPFSLRKEDIKVPDVCPIFRVPLAVGNRKNYQNAPSLDQIIPKKGYILDNVAVISRRANVIKNDGTSEDHRKIAAWMEGLAASSVKMSNPFAGKSEQKLVSKARERAKIKGLTVTIEKTDIVIPEICPVLGIPLLRGEGKLHDNSPTLDRVDPTLGYIPENIAVISYKANRMKNDGTAEEHKKIADWMDSMIQTNS